eukprot:8639802-Ditylum_brightwellii.AAC.1
MSSRKYSKVVMTMIILKALDTPRRTPQKHRLKSLPYKKMFASPVPTLHSSSQSNSDFQSIGSNGGTHDFLQEYGI